MATAEELRDDSVRVTVLRPTSVTAGNGGARATFERVWSRLPAFEGDSSFVALPDDGGVFLKGQRIRARVHPETPRQAGRLVRETRYLARMRAAGVPVPETLAHGVERRWGIAVRSFLLLRHLDGAEDLRSVVQTTTPDERTDVWEPVGRMVAELHATGLFHRDLTARNVLVRRVEGVVVPHLIDCPRAEHGWFPPRRAYLRRSDTLRLTRSVLKAGGSEREIEHLLDAMGARATAVVLDHVRRSARRGRGDPFRTKVWVMFGL